MKVRKTVSPAVVEKNRRNAQQSTGPKTPQGKRNSSFNSLKHGLTAQLLMFTSDGEPIDKGLAELVASLRERYGSGDIVSELLIDGIVADYWRLSKGLELEMTHFIRNGEASFHPKGATQNILRYNTSSRRALFKSLELLQKMQASESEPAADEVADTDISAEDGAGASVDDDAATATDDGAAATDEPEASDVSAEPTPALPPADAGNNCSENLDLI